MVQKSYIEIFSQGAGLFCVGPLYFSLIGTPLRGREVEMPKACFKI